VQSAALRKNLVLTQLRKAILWLSELPKAGDKHDAYSVFEKKVRRGEFPNSINDLSEKEDEGE